MPKRLGALVIWPVPVGTPRDVALALAREKAATLVAKGEQVGEVTLDGSREYGGREVARRFSFSVT